MVKCHKGHIYTLYLLSYSTINCWIVKTWMIFNKTNSGQMSTLVKHMFVCETHIICFLRARQCCPFCNIFLVIISLPTCMQIKCTNIVKMSVAVVYISAYEPTNDTFQSLNWPNIMLVLQFNTTCRLTVYSCQLCNYEKTHIWIFCGM